LQDNQVGNRGLGKYAHLVHLHCVEALMLRGRLELHKRPCPSSRCLRPLQPGVFFIAKIEEGLAFVDAHTDRGNSPMSGDREIIL